MSAPAKNQPLIFDRNDVYIVAVYHDNQRRGIDENNDMLEIYGLKKNKQTDALIEEFSTPEEQMHSSVNMNQYETSKANYYLPKNGNLIFQPAYQVWLNHYHYKQKMWVQSRTESFAVKGAPGGQPVGQPFYVGRNLKVSNSSPESLAPLSERFVDDQLLRYTDANENSIACQTRGASGELMMIKFMQADGDKGLNGFKDINHPELGFSQMWLDDGLRAEKQNENKCVKLNQAENQIIYKMMENQNLFDSATMLAYLGLELPPATPFTENIKGYFGFDAIIGSQEQKIRVPAAEIL